MGLTVMAGVRVIGLSLALLVGHVGYLHLSGNLHPVIKGELYRAGQLSPAALRRAVVDHGIRSIINLRGASDADWYRAERAAAHGLGLAYINYPISSRRILSQDQARDILEILRTAPKPVLVHCAAGADRTGLVSALYVAAIARLPEAVAESQLSIRYGHLAVPVLSAAWPMDESFEALEPWLGYTGS